MIVVLAELHVAPESRRALLDAARAIHEATLAEPGCLRYDFFENALQPDRFIFVEEWEDAEELRVHFNTSDMATFRDRIQSIVLERQTAIHEVSSTRRI